MVKKTTAGNTGTEHGYDDIIQMDYPFADGAGRKHPRMPVQERAKIFASFAALKGYGDAAAAKQKIVVQKMELSEESEEHLDMQIKKMQRLLEDGRHLMADVVYFQQGSREDAGCGEYIKFTGAVVKVDPVARMVQIAARKISFDDICSIGEPQESVKKD